ncbi:MAG: ERF family protein [Tenuifilaceae bacterium]
MNRSETISTLAASLVKAQREIEGAAKDKTNPHYRSKYADLASVADACKPALNRHGIAYVQAPEPSESGTLALTTMLVHESGEWMSGTCTMPLPKNDPQGYGSAMTYARRYALAAMVGVCPEDDDAEAATPKTAPSNKAADQRPKLASASQVKELKELLEVVRLEDGLTEKWLTKAGVEDWADMPTETIQACIEYVKKRLPKAGAA